MNYRFLLGLFVCCVLFADYEVHPKKMRLVEKALGRSRYYDITINGRRFHSSWSRSWKERWDILREKVDFQNERVLDLGTYVGLTPIFIKKYGGAESVVGVDRVYRERAEVLANAFEVKATFYKMDFDKDPNYESKLGTDFDIVCCFSLMHWVKDKQRLLNYLAHFDMIIYEGHDSLEEELARFAPFGYEHEVIGQCVEGDFSGRARDLIVFFRE